MNALSFKVVHNGWWYGVGLPCRLFHLTTSVNGKLHYTDCCVSGADFTDNFIKSINVVLKVFSDGQLVLEKQK